MDILCTADMCPVILNSTCVFYEGSTLTYTGITTNDSLQTALQKIDAKFGDAMVGYTFTNGVYQSVAGAPVGLGGNLIANTSIGGNFTLTFAGNLQATKHITTGGTSSQFVKGDGTLDSNAYQVAGNYITALSGDVIANGPGSAVASLAVVNSNPGTYGSGSLIPVVTVDTKGRVTALTTTAINVPSGILSFVGDVYGSGVTGSQTTLTLNNVNSNVYTNNTFLKFKVNAKGLVTGATPVTHLDVEAVLGYVPVPETRTITINGVTHDLEANVVFSLPGGGTVQSVSVTPGTGISATVANPTTTPDITIINTAPDQVVTITPGTGINVTGTYPNFTVAATNTGSVTDVTASAPLASSGGTTPNITISQAGPSANGFLSSGDWNTFNSKQPAGSYVVTSRAINTTGPLQGGGDLTSDRTLSITQSGISTDGYLSSTDWNTFNGKQAAGSYITALTGEATASGPGSAVVTLSTPAITSKLLTGVNVTGGSIVDTDSILTAFGKLQNQINGLIGGSMYKGTWNAATNTPTITSGVGTTGWYYIVSVPGTTNIDGITDWNLGDWIIFDGTAWQQVDNTDAVVSVNGYTGAVSLVSSDVPEGLTNLYYTPARARTAISLTTIGTTGLATYDNITGVLNVPNYATDLSGYVPYTGATTNVNLGEHGLTAGYVGFDLTPTGTPTGVGTMFWDPANRTVALIDGDGDTTLQIGQEERILVHNNTGSTLTDGQLVYVTGSTGNLPSVALASAATESTSAATIGMITEQILNGADGFITVSGIVNGLNTLAFNEGDLLWLSDTPGGFSTTKPISPSHLVLIGYVIKKAGGNGSVLVKIQNTQELSESSDVLISAPEVDGQGLFLQTISGTQLWRNRSIADVLGYTPANDANVVHITGNESISGRKTFTDVLKIESQTTIGQPLNIKQYNSYNAGDDGYTGIQAFPSSVSFTQSTGVGTYKNFMLSTVSLVNGTPRTYTLPNASGTLALTSDIPSLAGYVPTTRTLTINGETYDLSANRSWSIAAGVTSFNTRTGAITLLDTDVNTALGYTAANDANVVHKTGNETISGQKTFNGEIVNTIQVTSPTFKVQNSGNASLYTLILTNSSGSRNVYLPDADGTIALTSNLDAYVPTSRTLTINGTTYDLTANRSWTITAPSSSRDVFDYTATAAQTTFTVTGGYVVGLLDVYVNGVKLTSSEVTATNGTTFVLTVASIVGDQVQAIRYNAAVDGVSGSGTTGYISKFTASQTLANSGLYDNGTGFYGFNTTSVNASLNAGGVTINGTVGSSLTLQLAGVNKMQLYHSASYGTNLIGYENVYIGAGTDLILGGYQGDGIKITENGQILVGPGGQSFLPVDDGVTLLQLNGAIKAGAANLAGPIDYTPLTVRNLNNGDYYVGINFESGTDKATSAIRSYRTNSSTDYQTALTFWTKGTGAGPTSPTERMRIAPNGNVGIGTNSPISRLDINGGNIRMGELLNSASSYIGKQSSSNSNFYSSVQFFSSAAQDMIIFNTHLSGDSAGERMRISGGGRVLINTTNEQSQLIFKAKQQNSFYYGGIVVEASSNDSQLSMSHTGSLAVLSSSYQNSAGYSPLAFYTSDSERMRITNGGTVCIGTTTENAKLHVRHDGNGTTSNYSGIHIENSSTAVGSNVAARLSFSGDGNSSMAGIIEQRRDGGDSFWIRTLNGYSAAGYIYIQAQTNGVYLAKDATSWTSNSDERMKADLVPIEDATNKVSQLRSVIGRYKTDEVGTKRSFLIAQDVLEVLPEAVDINTSTGMMGVQYTEVIPLLVASIKELKAELDLLKNK